MAPPSSVPTTALVATSSLPALADSFRRKKLYSLAAFVFLCYLFRKHIRRALGWSEDADASISQSGLFIRSSIRNWILSNLGFPELLDARVSYTSNTDFNKVQAALLSTEHLGLGRVEKRTLAVRRLDEMFPNQYLRAKILKAAADCRDNEELILPIFLSATDKWHVLNTCTNAVSELFSSAHVYFNEARANDSYYRSAWYLFTITCTRNVAGGRFFITPSKPVHSGSDVGQLCLRIILVSENELRKIASGETSEPPKGFFNERHNGRWRVLVRMANLFIRQLESITDTTWDGNQDWGANLCGRLGATALERRKMRMQALGANSTCYESFATDLPSNLAYDPEDNCFLRIHIPYPGGQAVKAHDNNARACQDVVLYS
ncbi:unnamed protein product [Amoebophrya sp. A25]|nr:unnamed protein product [Amoebophrya sp. A25]|eukprot:GSA25T00018157001.1